MWSLEEMRQSLDERFSSQLNKLHGSRGVVLSTPFSILTALTPEDAAQALSFRGVGKCPVHACITEDNGTGIS